MRVSSLQLFRKYILCLPDGTLDATNVTSKECFEEWLKVKNAQASHSNYLKYYRTLTNHVSGVSFPASSIQYTQKLMPHPPKQVDGRSPFTQEEEAAILTLFRKKLPWPCLPNNLSHMGAHYRTKGYHEKQQLCIESTCQHPCAVSITPPLLLPSTTIEQDDIVLENVKEILRSLPPAQVTYVKNLGHSVAHNYATSQFDMAAWRSVNEVFRYMVFACTAKCKSTMPEESTRARANLLCSHFTPDKSTVSMVFDLTAKSYSDRALAQNALSSFMFDPLVGNDNGRITVGSELFRVVVAVAAAFNQPKQRFCVYGQQTLCYNGEVKMFDINYFVDSNSLLLVLFGKEVARK